MCRNSKGYIRYNKDNVPPAEPVRIAIKTLCREPHLPSQQRTIHGHIHILQFPISAENSEQVVRAGYRGGSVTEQTQGSGNKVYLLAIENGGIGMLAQEHAISRVLSAVLDSRTEILLSSTGQPELARSKAGQREDLWDRFSMVLAGQVETGAAWCLLARKQRGTPAQHGNGWPGGRWGNRLSTAQAGQEVDGETSSVWHGLARG
ncbi:hypothetical protein FIBSPDRAFT_882098 [Athelia psychrophila]|uniref:Uncharacterized protein n=1 Tax=Athelia psychrophila TaxID=1759441 RepID=A0A166VHV5_9AGAM|nr:hypothetical protein FIBSPDRAFT_882098 [Fibularhizoctonia sp. CBS 109695]